MKVFSITILMLFSTAAFAEDFYDRYLSETEVCTQKSREAQAISAYHFCIAGTVETLMMYEPANERKKYSPLVAKFSARGEAWEKYEDSLISETELNEILAKIDRNEYE